MELTQDGEAVAGSYNFHGGKIGGRADGRQLTGTWQQPEQGKGGAFSFILSRDGKTFVGRFGSGEWWTGQRVVEDDAQAVAMSRGSPMDVMRAFLVNMNESGADELERMSGKAAGLRSRAVSLVDLSRSERGEMSRLDYAMRLFAVLNQLTFRLWDLPDGGSADTASATLRQAGTGLAFAVDFRRTGEGWSIVGPPLSELDRKYAELAAARGKEAMSYTPEQMRTPRATFKLFLWALNTYGYTENNPAYRTLDTRELTAAVREQETPLLAAYIKQVLDRTGYVLWQELPDDPHATQPYVHFEHAVGSIAVAPVQTDEGVIWQFTPDTLSSIRALYAAMDDVPVVAGHFGAREPLYFKLRAVVREAMPAMLKPIGPLDRWQWLALALALGLAWMVGYAACLAIRHALSRWENDLDASVGTVLRWSVRAMAFGCFMLMALYALGLPDIVGVPVKALAWLCVVCGAVPVAWHLVGLASERYRRRWERPGYHDTLISLSTGVARVVIVVVGFLILAEVLAIPYEGVIAGLGIGGLAVALAAQPTLQNFLSGLTLYADRPVSVGDFCRFGERLGTIEHIGMRSTRIRSLDRTVISVPNAEFANLQLENYARRDQNRLTMTLKLRYETTPDQLRYVLAELRRMLLGHPKVSPDPCRVRFAGFGEYSLDLEVFAYVMTPDVNEFLAIREDICLRMMEIVRDAGTDYAVPAHVEYRAEDAGLDPQRIRDSEARVARWRAEHRLPFPDFRSEDKARMRDFLAYPPEGSPDYRNA